MATRKFSDIEAFTLLDHDEANGVSSLSELSSSEEEDIVEHLFGLGDDSTRNEDKDYLSWCSNRQQTKLETSYRFTT